MYVSCNIEMHSCNHFCSGKAISITYSEYEFVGLDIQDAKCMLHVVSGPSVCTTLFHVIS